MVCFHSPIDHTIHILVGLTKDLPVGTNLALLHFFWMLVSGALLPQRGAIFPALQAIGLSEAATRRAWAAFRQGAWQTVIILRLWQEQIEGLSGSHSAPGSHRLLGSPTQTHSWPFPPHAHRQVISAKLLLASATSQKGLRHRTFSERSSGSQAKNHRFSALSNALKRKLGSVCTVQCCRNVFPEVLASAFSGN